MRGVVALVVSGGLGLLFVWAVRRIARERGFVAAPSADRWHRQPTALGGGIAIALAVIGAMAATTGARDPIWGLLLGGALLLVVGFVDDCVPLKPVPKIVAQLVAAAIAILFGFHVRFFELDALNIAVSFLWIVAMTNAVNLLDNMDGLAAGVVLIAAACMAAGYAASAASAATLALALIGALAAFLVFNRPPATIFMGDSGSLFIGYLLATLSLYKDLASDVVTFVAVPALALLVPILDTSLVTITRVLRGRSIAQGGRDHSSHRLVRLGLSEPDAVKLLWGLAAVAGGAAAITQHISYSIGLGILPLLILGTCLLGSYLGRVQVIDRDAGGEAGGFVRLAIDFSAKGRIFEAVLDAVLAVTCYYLAYGLRFEFDPENPYWRRAYESLPLAVGATMLAFLASGVYRGIWRFMGINELGVFLRASGQATLFSAVMVIAFYRFEGYSRAVFAIYGALLFLALVATRASFQLIDDLISRRRAGRLVVIAGAGEPGEAAMRYLSSARELDLKPIGFVDDDVRMHGRSIHGYPVLGGLADLERIHAATPFEGVVLSSKSLPAERLALIRDFCERAHVSLVALQMELTDVRSGSADAKPLGSVRS
ncbi:MAG: hypothetical protein ACREQJ_07455 [Candidatus Binatia bacterium]